jgi:hypothetical protein
MNPQEERKLVAEIKNIDQYARRHEDDIYRGVWQRLHDEEEMRTRYEGRMEDMDDDFHDWKEVHKGIGEPAVIEQLSNILNNVKKPRGGKKMKKSKGKTSKRKGKTMKKRKGKTMKKRKGKTMKKRKH